MKTVLLFGAGKSATTLIDYLLETAPVQNWEIWIADADEKLIRSKTGGNKFARPVVINITDAEARSNCISKADIVISLMPPALHLLIAKDCLVHGKDLLTASYADADMLALSEEAKGKGLLFLCEMGLDPGIDHMSAMEMIDRIHGEGGRIVSFMSHCGGLVAPESDDNPWHYKISWNPRNVVMAGSLGARYKSGGRDISEDYSSLFDPQRRIPCPESGYMELSYYPNRDSLPYMGLYGLDQAETFIRTTLRHPEFMSGWRNLIELKLTDVTASPDTGGKTFQAFFREHLARHGFSDWLQQNLNEHLLQSKNLLEHLARLTGTGDNDEGMAETLPQNAMIVDESGNLKKIEADLLRQDAAKALAQKMHEANLILEQLLFLGLDDDKSMIEKDHCSPADVLQWALEKKLFLQPQDRDMVVMVHEIQYEKEGEMKNARSVLVVKGEDSKHTAMSKTVGLPLGIAAGLILEGKIPLSGVQIPTRKEVYEQVLPQLHTRGIQFTETFS